MRSRAAFGVGAGVTLAAFVACGGRDGSDPPRTAGRGGSSSALAGRSGGGSGGSADAAGVNGGRSGADGAGEAGQSAPGGATEAGAVNGSSAAGQAGETASGGLGAGAGEGGASGVTSTGGAASDVPSALNLFLMIDASWSMNQCADSSVTTGDVCMTGPTRWSVMSQALIAFVQDPEAAGLGVTLRFFPSDRPVAGCDGYQVQAFGGAGTGFDLGAGGAAGTTANCDATACAAPLVELGRLTSAAAPADTQEASLVSALQASTPPAALPNPNPATPTSAALAGAAMWAKHYQIDHPTESTSIVLVTDGEPQGCDTNANHIAEIAQDAYLTSAVRTFVLGFGGVDQIVLDAFAAGGGTHQAFSLGDGTDVTTKLLAALKAIRLGTTP